MANENDSFLSALNNSWEAPSGSDNYNHDVKTLYKTPLSQSFGGGFGDFISNASNKLIKNSNLLSQSQYLSEIFNVIKYYQDNPNGSTDDYLKKRSDELYPTQQLDT